MRSRRILGIAAAATIAGGAVAASSFSFRGIEFAPAEQRLPAARAYLRATASPGTPLVRAVAAMRRAEAGCRRPAPDGTVLCTYSRVSSSSLDDLPLGDVTWTVRFRPAADGTVAQADVTRERAGP